MRSKHKSWQNKNSGWDRRITWYQDNSSIRLKMEDLNYGVYNTFFIHNIEGKKAAQHVFDKFKNGMNIPDIKLI